MGAFAIFLLLIGMINLFVPRAAWFASIGWKIRDAKPSDAYLILHRIGGVIACIIAIVMIMKGTSGTTEQTIRDHLISSQIESVTLQMHPLSSFNADEVTAWIRKADWETPAVDYSKQNSFSAIAELDLNYVDGHDIQLFYMGDAQFGISENSFYPECVFSSALLEKWLLEQKHN